MLFIESCQNMIFTKKGERKHLLQNTTSAFGREEVTDIIYFSRKCALCFRCTWILISNEKLSIPNRMIRRKYINKIYILKIYTTHSVFQPTKPCFIAVTKALHLTGIVIAG